MRPPAERRTCGARTKRPNGEGRPISGCLKRICRRSCCLQRSPPKPRKALWAGKADILPSPDIQATWMARSSSGMSRSASKLTSKGFAGAGKMLRDTSSSRMFQIRRPGGTRNDTDQRSLLGMALVIALVATCQGCPSRWAQAVRGRSAQVVLQRGRHPFLEARHPSRASSALWRLTRCKASLPSRVCEHRAGRT